MRHPKIVVLETDGALAHYLAPLAETRRQPAWLLRECRQGPACLNVLAEEGPAVLVCKFGRHLVRELTFVDELHHSLPHVPIVAVGDAEDAALMSLALELGAAYVLQPPQPRQQLADIVTALMEASIRRRAPAPAAPAPPDATEVPELTHEPEP